MGWIVKITIGVTLGIVVVIVVVIVGCIAILVAVVSSEEFEAAGGGIATPRPTATLTAGQVQWRGQYPHWDRLDELEVEWAAVNVDLRVSPIELQGMCQRAEEWQGWVTAARLYMEEYRRERPNFVGVQPTLQALVSRIAGAQQVLDELDRECLGVQQRFVNDKISVLAKGV